MSAESEREAALEIHGKARDLNRAIEHAHLLGLRVDVKIEVAKIDGSTRCATHVVPYVCKLIEPAETARQS